MQISDDVVRVADKRKDKDISPDEIHRRFRYDPATGELFWLSRPAEDFDRKSSAARWNNMFAGKVAGWVNSHGYVHVRLDGKALKGHRVAWCLYHGNWPKADVDHINGVRSDNRISNLRDASEKENGRNKGIAINNKSGQIGVFWSEKKQRWIANIRQNKKNVCLGRFFDFKSAREARLSAERKYGFHPLNGSRHSFRALSDLPLPSPPSTNKEEGK